MTGRLLPCPRSLKQAKGFFLLPRQAVLQLDRPVYSDHTLSSLAPRVKAAALYAGVDLAIAQSHSKSQLADIQFSKSHSAPPNPEGYRLIIDEGGIRIYYRELAGLRVGVATLRQLFREYGRRLPRLVIHDYPDFPRRGVMLDISRGRVPKIETLLELADHLADFKINELQLYTEHTFAYRKYRPVWQAWGALTAHELKRLSKRCRELGIDLVPNQNSFGHLRYWLEYPPLKKLAETRQPYEDGGGTFLRYPSTLAPRNPGTLPFLRRLYDELLPNFSSTRFNVGCDETWDLGRGQSKKLCETRGKGRVYVEFLKRIHREVSTRKRRMMFWGDIILHHPELLKDLPRDCIVLNWGYEAGHPFKRETAAFAKSRLAFYVCPGTSTWMSFIGRHDNALTNLREAATAGLANHAEGFLITDWGDGGHPQPLAVSYLPYAAGAALAWCAASFDVKVLVPALSRDVFRDTSHRLAGTALALGLVHQKLGFRVPNLTPLGAVLAAPPPELRELFCRDGLKYYAQIPEKNIRQALGAIEKQRGIILKSQPKSPSGKMLARELEMAARMAAHSCRFMLWQQARASGNQVVAGRMDKQAIRNLRALERDFNAYWPLRNKGTTAKCSTFLRWRIDDYRRRE